MTYQTRNGRHGDLEQLREIERSAGQAFAEFDMQAIADDEPPSVEALAEYCDSNRLWVATDDQDIPVAYLVAELVDGCAHIEQVSVHSDHAGHGLGRLLIDRLTQWANERGLSALTLTTFSEVPWNRPYYERLGFRVLSPDDLTPGVRAVRQQEAKLGLDAWPRVSMRFDLT